MKIGLSLMPKDKQLFAGTTNLSLGVDTILELYDFRNKLVCFHMMITVEMGPACKYCGKLRRARYYVRVAQAPGSSFGCDASYEISITTFLQN